MIKTLKDKNKKIIDDLVFSNKQEELKKQLLIASMLEDEQCFFKLDMNTALSILTNLGYSNEERLNIYKKLTSFEEFKKYNKDVKICAVLKYLFCDRYNVDFPLQTDAEHRLAIHQNAIGVAVATKCVVVEGVQADCTIALG